MEKDEWLDDTLIALKRTYGKDEYVAALLVEISKRDIEIGKLNSEVQHLNQAIINLAKVPKETIQEKNRIAQQAKLEARKQDFYLKAEKEIKELTAEVERLKKSNNHLITANLELKKHGK